MTVFARIMVGGGVIPKEFGNRVVFKFVDHLFM